MSDLIRQELINRLLTNSEGRRKDQEAAYTRTVHNRDLEALVLELSLGVDE